MFTNLNRANVLKLAEYFEAMAAHAIPDLKIGYNQACFEPDSRCKDRSTNKCATNCCIAGHAVILFGDETKRHEFIKYGRVFGDTVSRFASQALGLELDERWKLFTSDPYGGEWDDDMETYVDFEPTAAEAAKMLRHLAETGECVWPPRGLDHLDGETVTVIG